MIIKITPRSSVIYSRAHSMETANEPECRICLATDTDDDAGDDDGVMVQPCSCTGTLEHAHLGCLKAWVRERADLVCEICKAPYAQKLQLELEREIARATAARLNISTDIEAQAERSVRRRRNPMAWVTFVTLATVAGALILTGGVIFITEK